MTANKYIVILTISSTEYHAVCAHLVSRKTETLKGPSQVKVDGFSSKSGVFEDYTVIVVCAFQRGQRILTGLNAALFQYSPALIIFVGVGGGVGDNVSIGTVVISDYIADHTLATEHESGETSYHLKGGPVHPLLVPLASNVRDSGVWINRIKPPKEVAAENIKKQIIVGTISAGNVLVHGNEGPVSRVLAAGGMDTYAVEMESAAIYDCATAVHHIPFCSVRGISDLKIDKDPKTDEYRQPWAAAHASAAAFELIHLFIRDRKSAEPVATKEDAQSVLNGENTLQPLSIPRTAEGDRQSTQISASANPSGDVSWTDVFTILKFGKRPLATRGQIIHVHVAFRPGTLTASKEECTALGLEYGDSVSRGVNLRRPQMGSKVISEFEPFLSKVYASSDIANWLEEVDLNETYKISLRLEFGSALVRKKFVPEKIREALPNFYESYDSQAIEETKYFAGMILIAGEKL